MNYKEVFELAKQKGYEFHFDWSLFLHSLTEEELITKSIMEVSLILKWLRDEQYINIQPMSAHQGKRWIVHLSNIKTGNFIAGYSPFSTYEEALLQGIHEALKLINN